MPNGTQQIQVRPGYAAPSPRQVVQPGIVEGEADTHGQTAVLAGSVAAGDTTIGTLTLPANGPWLIFGVWCQIVQQTATAGETFGGHFRLNSLDGDVYPNPAPSRFPTGLGGSFLGGVQQCRVTPLKIWPVYYEAPGKARIELIYNEASAVTVATLVAMGIMYGKSIPSQPPFLYIDRVRAAVAAAADTVVGTVTLAEKARRITYIGCQIAQDGVLTAGEELMATFRLSSDDVNVAPSSWPCNAAFSAGLGATIELPLVPAPQMIPVNIPVPGGARIDCAIDLATALTNAAEVEIFIAYE